MLSLTTSETEVNYYTGKLNARIALRVAKRPKADDLRKLAHPWWLLLNDILGLFQKQPFESALQENCFEMFKVL